MLHMHSAQRTESWATDQGGSTVDGRRMTHDGLGNTVEEIDVQIPIFICCHVDANVVLGY